MVFGGQLLAQAVIAAQQVDPAKAVLSVQAVFSRSADPEELLDVVVEPMHIGSTLGSVTVTIGQGDRTSARVLALLSADEGDLVRHGASPPDVGGPEQAVVTRDDWWQLRTVGAVDVMDPDAVGPPELHLWSRFPGAPPDDAVARALLAFASDGFLIGTAMRPHPGIGQSLAHIEFSTTVMTHTLTFHEPFDASEWLLLSMESPFAGRGRSHGRGQVFDEAGHLVASFVQDNVIRAFPPGRAPLAGQRSRH